VLVQQALFPCAAIIVVLEVLLLLLLLLLPATAAAQVVIQCKTPSGSLSLEIQACSLQSPLQVTTYFML
jgi:hypothetical protein